MYFMECWVFELINRGKKMSLQDKGRIYHLTQCQWPRAQMVRLCFGLHLYLAERCCENLPSTRSPAQCKSGPAIIWLVDITNIVPCFNNNSLTPRATEKKFSGGTMVDTGLPNLIGPPSLIEANAVKLFLSDGHRSSFKSEEITIFAYS